jgi:hypothetical protein
MSEDVTVLTSELISTGKELNKIKAELKSTTDQLKKTEKS